MHAHALNIYRVAENDTHDAHTRNIESLYIMVASLQVSDGGQNISKISGIFKFDVPL